MNRLLIITQKVDENDQLLGFFIDWLAGLAQKFDQINVICLEKGDFDLPDNVKVISLGKEEDNFQFSIFNFQSIFNVKIFKKIKYLARFYKLIWQMRRNYDAIFVHMNPIWIVLGKIVWKILNKKIYLWYTHKSVTWKLKIAASFAYKIFTASKESFRFRTDELLAVNKLQVTGHGIDTELFKPSNEPKLEDGKLKILSVGRIAPVKNYEALIDASKILRDQNINFRVTMIGEPAIRGDKIYENKLKSKIKNLGLENHFNFLGKINHKDLPSYYQSHDLFVHLSKTGSLDKTILEAMSCGIKFLSSNDASKSFLPKELTFDENSGKNLADKIKNVANMNIPSWRDAVINEHSLRKLIKNISTIIES